MRSEDWVTFWNVIFIIILLILACFLLMDCGKNKSQAEKIMKEVEIKIVDCDYKCYQQGLNFNKMIIRSKVIKEKEVDLISCECIRRWE